MFHARTRKLTRRGAATVEFAVIVPVLVMILMFSMYLTELVRAKLKLLEMARYTTFEMTSYTLTDIAKAEHDAAFDDAKKEALEEALERYKDMDSVEPNARAGNFIANYTNVKAEVTNREVPFIEGGLVLGNSGEGWASDVLGAVNGGAKGLLNFWKLNTKGWVDTSVSMKFANSILPKRYLEESGSGGFFKVNTFGNRNLANLELKSHFSMYATGWNLPDGGDAVINGRRAGGHTAGGDPHGLYQQVNRMTFLGVKAKIESSPLGSVLDFFKKFSPAFLGTFVISKNYGLPGTLECTGINTFPANGVHGLQDQMTKSKSLLDYERPQCFDTAPFRDRELEKSQYIKIFEARGENFMGCKNAQAEDPSAANSVAATKGDENQDIRNCE
ncbi:pilus assembly protein [Corallococcus sp. H22C18031201]|uniref:TadE/TadG family type IV pilus assembly protein n=1 Tax=Citreicoccus inhibens TaxID=2849499 RepID=UPI000E7223AD|nr:TadE family protein [Citreicoccus inhibens]MBU8896580.1 pilus assembly protein [Citreicoccus inhibens]RJS18712.1 pilus assembly protein [Corallococcus sp. H22C18031201]